MKHTEENPDNKIDAALKRRKLIADFPSGIVMSVCLGELLRGALPEQLRRPEPGDRDDA